MGVPPIQPTFADINQTANKLLGYTELMGVPPKVQPTFADSNHTANQKLGYTALMGVPPKVQPTFADIIHTANKKLGYTAFMGVPPKVQPTIADIIHTANKKLGYTALMGVPPNVQPTFADIIHTANKNWVKLHSWVCHLTYSLRLLTLFTQLKKNWVTLRVCVFIVVAQRCSLLLLIIYNASSATRLEEYAALRAQSVEA